MAALSVVTLSRNEQKMKSKLKSAKDGLDSKIKVKTQKITNIKTIFSKMQNLFNVIPRLMI